MKEIVDIAALNSRVKFNKTDIPFDQRIILGDATETGLTRFAGRSLDSDYDTHLKTFSKVFEGTIIFLSGVSFSSSLDVVPFNPVNKWALVIVSSFEFHVATLFDPPS